MSEYPNSTKYSISDVDEADRLWDLYPLHRVSQKTGIPKRTLEDWSKKGHISTNADHSARSQREYTKDHELVQRADRLWDVMPLSDVAEITGASMGTLKYLARKELIHTDTNHQAQSWEKRNRERAHRAARLASKDGVTQKEVADRMDVSEASVSAYLKMYRQGTYKHADLE